VGSRYGVDLSDPWADKRVLEFFLHLPVEYLFRDGWTKYLARVAFAGGLEDWVRFRSDKEHLGWALVDRLLRESGEFVDQTIENELDCIGEYVNPDRVRELHREYRSSGEPAVAEQIYDIMTLLLWVRRLQF
jgi:asparagine synthase (glutamine-hydrolysing)